MKASAANVSRSRRCGCGRFRGGIVAQVRGARVRRCPSHHPTTCRSVRCCRWQREERGGPSLSFRVTFVRESFVRNGGKKFGRSVTLDYVPAS